MNKLKLIPKYGPGGQAFRKIGEALIKKGWTLNAKGIVKAPNGTLYKYVEDKLMSLASIADREKSLKVVDKAKKSAKKAADKTKKEELKFTKLVLDFFDESGLDYSLNNWSLLGGGYKMSKAEERSYKEKAVPSFIKTFRRLVKEGKLYKDNGVWYGHFDNPILPDVNTSYKFAPLFLKTGFRSLPNGPIGAMLYVLAHSPQGRKLFYNGIQMRSGTPRTKKQSLLLGEDMLNFEKWNDSNIAGSSAYENSEGKGGISLYHAPIKPTVVAEELKTRGLMALDDPHAISDTPKLIKRNPHYLNPDSNNWAAPGSPIGSFVTDNPYAISISEGPLKDHWASETLNNDIRGHFTIVGRKIPIKSWFGGTGMYDIKGSNLWKPMAAIASPLTLTSILLNGKQNSENIG